ncbi:MAG: methyltransferase domain-containing protein [Acidobacteriota bacterium]
MSEAAYDLQFTGERVVPGHVEPPLWAEHMARYAFAANFVAGRRVLDFACGAGYGSAFLRSAGARTVVGNDVAFEALRYAQTRYRRERPYLVVSDCLSSSFRSGSFDIIVSFEAIEHVSSYRKFLREARRILADDGLLVLSTPNKRTYTDEADRAENPFHTHEFYLDEFESELAEHFECVELFGQATIEGQLFFAGGKREAQTESSAELRGKRNEGLESTDFFIAVCANRAGARQLAAASELLYLGGTTELNRLRNDLARLQKEFDDKGRVDLEDRLVRLQQEFDERTRWALQLNTEVVEKEAQLAEQQVRLDSSNREVFRLQALAHELEDRVARLEAQLAGQVSSAKQAI